MNRIFSIQQGSPVPDETTVYPFLNPRDSTSGLPWHPDLGFSLAAGDIEPGVASQIHVMPFATQVTLALQGHLDVWMQARADARPYRLQVGPQQAVLTLPGTRLQFHNTTEETCRVLYVVSPPYVYELDPQADLVYNDAIMLGKDWDVPQCRRWWEYTDLETMARVRRRACERLATQRGAQEDRRCGEGAV